MVREDYGSNHLVTVSKLGISFTPRCLSSLGYINDSGEYTLISILSAVIPAWLNASHTSRIGV